MSDDKFNNFNLVDGTALALKVGHRVSVDIDLFSTEVHPEIADMEIRITILSLTLEN